MSKNEKFEVTFAATAKVGEDMQASQVAYDKARKAACQDLLDELKAAKELYFFNTVYTVAVFNQVEAEKNTKSRINKQICDVMGWTFGKSQQKFVSAVLFSENLASILETAETVEDTAQILLSLSKSGVKSFNALKNWYGQQSDAKSIPEAEFEKSDNDATVKEIRKDSPQNKDLLGMMEEFLGKISGLMEEKQLEQMRAAMLRVAKTIGQEKV